MRIRTLFLIALLMTAVSHLRAQDPERRHTIGLFQTFTDYNVRLLDGQTVVFDSALSHGTRLGYQNRLSKTWMLSLGLSNGFINNQSLNDQYIRKGFSLGVDAAIMLKLNNGRWIKEDALFGPYLTFGYRIDYVNRLRDFDVKPWLTHNQYGIGTHIRLSQRTHIQVQTAIDQKLQGDFNTHLRYRIGLTQSLGKLKDEWTVPADPVEDVVTQTELVTDSVALNALQAQLDSLREQNLALESNQAATQASLDSALLALATSEEDASTLQTDSDSEADEATSNTETDPTMDPAETTSGGTLDGSGGMDLPKEGEYYVIVISVRDANTAKTYHEKVVLDFGEGFILPQPTGFYRVGIRAGTSFSRAKGIMEQVKAKGYSPVWIAKE